MFKEKLCQKFFNIFFSETIYSFSDIFSQISDTNGHLILWKFSEYLKEVLALPAAVYESPSFSYSDDLANSIFNTVNFILN